MRKLVVLTVLLSTFASLAQEEKLSLKVLTFNVWMVRKLGFSISSKLEYERLPLIVENINRLDPDIIAIQEVWDFGLRQELIQRLRGKYGYFHYRDFNGMGDGMLLLTKSRYPIMDEGQENMSFSDGTAIEEWRLPIFGVKKGAFRVTVNVRGTPLDIFTFHMGAVYFCEQKSITCAADNDYDPDQVRRRRGQMDELFHFVSGRENFAHDMIVLGDLNNHFFEWDPKTSQRIRQKTYEYRRFTDEMGLSDSFMEANGLSLETDALEKLRLYTFDTKNNHYAAKGAFSKIPPEFIDYIFYRQNRKLKAVSSYLVFNHRLASTDPETVPVHLSDHWGVVTEFELRR